jgi:hypothetical protein
VVYARETRHALLFQNPTMDGKELSDKVVAGWKDLDPGVTAYYADQAGADECSGDVDPRNIVGSRRKRKRHT